MKKIRVKFLKFGSADHTTPGSYANLFYSLLQKKYEVEISETPDYIFYHESSDEHLNYNCVKIFYTGENVSPNFNFCDYAIGFDWLDFSDRYYRFPIYLNAIYYRPEEITQSANIDWTKPANLTRADMEAKTEFCSFVYSNYRGELARQSLFDALSVYKKVNAGGAYLNNVGGRVENKLAFEAKHKFSIACENSSRSGYTTEKIIGSFLAKTIPIYWGDPDVAKQFNPKRFINCHDFKSFDEVRTRVAEIDEDDDLYLSMVNEPITIPEYNFTKVHEGLEAFLQHIFDQPVTDAKRATINPNRLAEMEKREHVASWYTGAQLKLIQVSAKIYQPLKKFPWFEKLKHTLFQSK